MKKMCSACRDAVEYVRNEEFSKREMVMAVVAFFLLGLTMGVFLSPKGNKTYGSHNGCNSGNNNSDSGIIPNLNKDEKDEKDEKKEKKSCCCKKKK